MLFRTILFAFIISSIGTRANHAIYLSVVEINKDMISVKVFSDDLQDVIRNYSKETILSGLDAFVTLNENQINAYFNEKFRLMINEKLIALELKNSKIENDAHFLYFSFDSEEEWKQFSISKGDFFTELFPDQSNVIKIIKGDEKVFARLSKSNPSYEVIFD